MYKAEKPKETKKNAKENRGTDMNLQQLTTFCTVLSEGSMTAAAEKLYLTQPAVSQQIRSLEEELKVALLVRGVRQVKPTMQGQLLYDYAKRILHLTQQAEVAIHTLSQEVSGHIRIGTINSLGLYLVSPIIGMLLKHNANLSVKLVYGSFDKIVDGMQTGMLDLTVLPDVEKESDVEFNNFDQRFLMKDEMWLVGSGRDTSLPAQMILSKMVEKPVVLFSEVYPRFQRLIKAELEKTSTHVVPVFESDNVGTLKRVIESGLGWGFLPSHCIRKQVRTRRLHQIQVKDLSYTTSLNMYVRRGTDMERIGDVFFRAFQQQAATK